MKKLITAIVLFLSGTALAIAAYPGAIVYLNGVKVTGSSKAFQYDAKSVNKVAQTVLTGASAVSATVSVEGSLDGTNWSKIGTMTVYATPAVSAVSYMAITNPWSALRATVDGISSVGGAISANSAVVTTVVTE